MQNRLQSINTMFNNFQSYVARKNAVEYSNLWDKLLFRAEFQFRINKQFSNFPEASYPQKSYIAWWQNALERRAKYLQHRSKVKENLLKRLAKRAALENQKKSNSVDVELFIPEEVPNCAHLHNEALKNPNIKQFKRKSSRGYLNGLLMDKTGKFRTDKEIAKLGIDIFSLNNYQPSKPKQRFEEKISENPLLEATTILPKRVQNTPPVKRKGPETTKATTEGRVYRKCGIKDYKSDYAQPNKASSETSNIVLLNAEERRQQRGQAFYQQWCKENADLLQQAA